MAKILIIDDSPDLLEMTRKLLEDREGHEVMVSTDGEDGLTKAFSTPPDLAIVDVMMPGITGYDVCRQLRANPSTAAIPILILTARGQSVDREAALEAGANAHVVKPVDVKELIDLVDELLAGSEPQYLLRPAGKIVLLSLRGGVGITTLAVNLAIAAAAGEERDVCLVDLSSSSGHAALQLGLRPNPNWLEFITSERRSSLNAETIRACLLQHESGVHLLASPLTPLKERGWSREEMQATLNILQQQFSSIIIDAPSVLNAATMTALEAATLVGLVVTAEPPSIQTSIGTLRVLKHLTDKLYVIINQVRPEAPLPRDALDRVLKRPTIGRVPFDPAQAQALAQGTPLTFSKPDSPMAEAVRKLARDVIYMAESGTAS